VGVAFWYWCGPCILQSCNCYLIFYFEISAALAPFFDSSTAVLTTYTRVLCSRSQPLPAVHATIGHMNAFPAKLHDTFTYLHQQQAVADAASGVASCVSLGASLTCDHCPARAATPRVGSSVPVVVALALGAGAAHPPPLPPAVRPRGLSLLNSSVRSTITHAPLLPLWPCCAPVFLAKTQGFSALLQL
jgi:hypothetical protein